MKVSQSLPPLTMYCPTCKKEWDGKTTLKIEDPSDNTIVVFPKCKKCKVRISNISLCCYPKKQKKNKITERKTV